MEGGIQCLHTASLQYGYHRHTLEAPVLWPVILNKTECSDGYQCNGIHIIVYN
jgi:hypothetical protein